jgi:hypothetical protein
MPSLYRSYKFAVCRTCMQAVVSKLFGTLVSPLWTFARVDRAKEATISETDVRRWMYGRDRYATMTDDDPLTPLLSLGVLSPITSSSSIVLLVL